MKTNKFKVGDKIKCDVIDQKTGDILICRGIICQVNSDFPGTTFFIKFDNGASGWFNALVCVQ